MIKIRRFANFAIASIALQFLACAFAAGAPFQIGSKIFTESVVLAEIAKQHIEAAGVAADRPDPLGGTALLWAALLKGDIDAYPEYTGTIAEEIFGGKVSSDPEKLAAKLAENGIGMTEPLGFNNTYAIGLREADAAAANIRKLSDLRTHPELKIGLSNEFLKRKDGWPGLRGRYGLPQEDVNGLDHDLAYRALESHSIDATDLYSTDAEIAYYKLRVLEDDAGYFPQYKAVFLYRLDLAARAPAAVTALKSLQGKIDEAHMIAMNARVKNERVPEGQVAAEFIGAAFGGAQAYEGRTKLQELGVRTVEHLDLVGRSLVVAIAVGIPLGVIAARWRHFGQVVLATVAAIYTIPSLALLVFMIPVFGIGKTPAVIALFLYSLLPIVRNTHAGLLGIPRPLRESAEALGLPAWAKLWRIELPLAAPSILAGIKTAAVINVGTATLGALIRAGGYGQPILTGIRLNDTKLILLGAIPAAVMALLIQGLFELIERTWARM